MSDCYQESKDISGLNTVHRAISNPEEAKLQIIMLLIQIASC